MEKFRLGVVGLGHRGRDMFTLAGCFDCVELAAACDIRPSNWYEKQWRMEAPLAELLSNAVFYENYDQMLEETKLTLLSWRPALISTQNFAARPWQKTSTCFPIFPW